MKIKLILVILLLFVLFLNFFSLEKFSKIDRLNYAKDRYIIELERQINQEDRSKMVENLLKEDTTNPINSENTFSLKKNKILLSLYYNSRNVNSYHFYDYKRNNVDNYIFKKAEELNLEYKYASVQSTNGADESIKKYYQKVVKRLENEISSFASYIQNEIHNRISNNTQNSKTWNLIKGKYLDPTEPLLDSLMMTFEEVDCDNHMDTCHKKNSFILPANLTPTQSSSQNNTISTINLEENLKKNWIDIIKYINENVTAENKIIKHQKSKSFTRSENFITKLPQVVLTFHKPTVTIDDNNMPTIEDDILEFKYNGIYSMNDKENPVAVNNLLKFIQEKVDEHLEIKEDIDGSLLEEDIEQKKKNHIEKFHNIQPYTSSSDHFDEIPKKTSKYPLYINYKMWKCKHCPMFVKDFS